MRRLRLSNKVGIKSNEIFKFFSLVTFLFGASELMKDVRILYKRVMTLNKKSGSNFTFLYLKEVMRLCIKYLAGSPDLIFSKGIGVRRDKSGLPVILTKNLRNHLISKNQLMVKYIMSLISIYRVFSTKPKLKLSSIVDPFEGIVDTFESSKIRLAISELYKLEPSIVLKPYKFVKLESASPHGFKSLGNSSSDIISLLHNPSHLKALLFGGNLCYLSNVLILLGFCLQLIIGIPFSVLYLFKDFVPNFVGYPDNNKQYPISNVNSFKIFGKLFYSYPDKMQLSGLSLGRLGVVLDQAGKARIVAMTNYGIQLGLKPIHDFIFDNILRNIEQDATFDQMKPLDVLIQKESTESYYCFDLSAATDRLPINLQRDILNCLSNNLGDRGKEILDINWTSVNRKYYVKYSVGQPMGAYSSGAMLAFTHHVIVKIASGNVGINQFTDYCILGDDIVIRNELVATEYLSLMKLLGVSINLSKSVISKDFAEFAKVGKGHKSLNYTPIGPGLILRLIRDNNYLGNVLSEMIKIGIVSNYGALLKILDSLPKALLSKRNLGLGSIFGLKGSFGKKFGFDEFFFKDSIGAIISDSQLEFSNDKYHYTNLLMFNTLLIYRRESIMKDFLKLKLEFKYFMINCIQMTSDNGSLRFFEIVSRFVSPSFGVYFYGYLKETVELIDEYFRGHYSSYLLESKDGSYIEELMDVLPSISSINGTDKKKVKAYGDSCKRITSLMKLFYKLQEKGRFYFNPFQLEQSFKEKLLEFNIISSKPAREFLVEFIAYPNFGTFECNVRSFVLDFDGNNLRREEKSKVFIKRRPRNRGTARAVVKTRRSNPTTFIKKVNSSK